MWADLLEYLTTSILQQTSGMELWNPKVKFSLGSRSLIHVLVILLLHSSLLRQKSDELLTKFFKRFCGRMCEVACEHLPQSWQNIYNVCTTFGRIISNVGNFGQFLANDCRFLRTLWLWSGAKVRKYLRIEVTWSYWTQFTKMSISFQNVGFDAAANAPSHVCCITLQFDLTSSTGFLFLEPGSARLQCSGWEPEACIGEWIMVASRIRPLRGLGSLKIAAAKCRVRWGPDGSWKSAERMDWVQEPLGTNDRAGKQSFAKHLQYRRTSKHITSLVHYITLDYIVMFLP